MSISFEGLDMFEIFTQAGFELFSIFSNLIKRAQKRYGGTKRSIFYKVSKGLIRRKQRISRFKPLFSKALRAANAKKCYFRYRR
jgi:hypothetical protein